MAMRKVNYRVKAGIAAVVFALGGSTLPGNVCINAPATVQAEEGTGAESESQQVINLNTSWKYLDNNTDPAAGLRRKERRAHRVRRIHSYSAPSAVH